MQEAFHYLVRNPDDKIIIVLGSLLSFLAALRVALIGNKKVLFMRKTKTPKEGTSIFWIEKSMIQKKELSVDTKTTN